VIVGFIMIGALYYIRNEYYDVVVWNTRVALILFWGVGVFQLVSTVTKCCRYPK